VVAGVAPLAEAAERVGGRLVEVDNLTPAGSEPHDLELTARQVARIEDADVVVYAGRGFQPAVAEHARRRRRGDLDLLGALDLGDATVTDGDGAEEPGDGVPDPHFWLDPRILARAVDRIRDVLSEISPDDAPTFAANARAAPALPPPRRSWSSKACASRFVTSRC
jgi:zinc transport system substrate-binding protein